MFERVETEKQTVDFDRTKAGMLHSLYPVIYIYNTPFKTFYTQNPWMFRGKDF